MVDMRRDRFMNSKGFSQAWSRILIGERLGATGGHLTADGVVTELQAVGEGGNGVRGNHKVSNVHSRNGAWNGCKQTPQNGSNREPEAVQECSSKGSQ